MIIRVSCSKNCAKADLNTRPTAVKYPDKTADIAKKGRLVEMILKERMLLESFIQNTPICLAHEIIIRLASVPKNKPYIRQLRTILLILPLGEAPSSSETSLVVANLIPEIAKVVNSVYTDIIRPNRPTPEALILLVKYT